MGKILVIGGGAAGMMAAISAAEHGASVLLLEKNEKLGKKIYITGKGRCNVTNDSDAENLLQHVRSNPKFLYTAFYSFGSQAMMAFLEEEGLPLKTERGARVFPKSDKASDVIRTLAEAMKKRGVQVRLNTEVRKLVLEGGRACGVETAPRGERNGRGEIVYADAVIVATGGLSYPVTGSTGDGYRFAGEAGHHLADTVPSLVPFEVKEAFAGRMQGLSLRNISMSILQGKKVLYQDRGEILFTHFGISGPLVLAASTYIPGKKTEGITIHIDLKPALTRKQLDARVQKDFLSKRNSQFKNCLGKLLPSKMIPVMIELSGIAPEKKVNEVTKAERLALVDLLKGLTMTFDGLRGYSEAVITRGGICVKEVEPATMESKQADDLYFAGEVLDLDAVTGGYNLQIAWSTGYLAGMSAAQKAAVDSPADS